MLEDYLECGRRTSGACGRCSRPGASRSGRRTSCRTRSSSGGESLVRNLLLGRRVCRRFGVEPSGAGYLPDSFGHPAQLPQILAGFGIRTFLFSRGLGDEIDEVGVVFRWRAGRRGGRRVPVAAALRQLRAAHLVRRRRGARPRDRRALRRARARRGPGGDPARERLRPPADRARAAGDPRRAGEHIRRVVPDRPLRRARACARRAAGARGRARRQPAPERPARRQLGADLPQAGERAGRAAAALDRDGRRAADTARGRSVPGLGAAPGVAGPAPQPSARLDLRLLVRRGAPRHARPLRAAPPDARLHRTRGARSRRRPREHAPLPAAPARGRGGLRARGVLRWAARAVRLSGAADPPRGDRGSAGLRGRAGRRRPVHVLSRREGADGGARLLARRRRRARARARAAGDPDRDDDPPRERTARPVRADDRRRERGGGPPAARSLPLGGGRRRGTSREPVRRRPPSALPAGSACGLGRAAGADGAHARCRRPRAARPAHEGAAGVRGRRRRGCA